MQVARRKAVAVAVAQALGASMLRNFSQYAQRAGLHVGALPLVVDSVDALPEPQRALYVPRDDGKFRLDVDGFEDPAPLRAQIRNLNDESAKRRLALKEMEDRYAGIDPDEARALKSRLDNDEEGRLIAAGKIDEVVAKRTEKQRLDQERKVKDAEAKAAEAVAREAEKDAKLSRFSQRALGFHVSQFAAKAGTHAEVVEDALLLARSEGWTIDDDGEPVQLNKDGAVVIGKDTKTPFKLADWFEEKRASRKYWWPAQNSGGGAGGGGGNRGSSGQDLSGLKPTERMTMARQRAGR